MYRPSRYSGKGTFKNVRLEARPDNIERLGEWKWTSNPFVGTKELQGLKMMMVFMTNWDVLDLQNKILQVGDENHYIVSDLGSTFGRRITCRPITGSAARESEALR